MPRLNPIDRFSVFVGEKFSVVFLASVILTFYEVIMRYVFNAPTIWVHDSAIALSATGFLLAGTYALQRREHIRISVVYDAMPAPLRGLCDVVNATLTAIYLAFLLYAGLKQAIPSVSIPETTGHAWDVPIPAYLKSVLAAAAAIMLAQAVVQLAALVRRRN